MKGAFRNLLIFLFIGFQVIPIIIVWCFTFNQKKMTGNSGWVKEKDRDCRFYTGYNYENREFVWSGNCKEGLVDGFGTLRMFENNVEYYLFEGHISNGIIQGYGKLIILSDGDIYEGDYVNGKLHGQGHFYNDDGDHYKGDFKEGLRSGNGTYWYPPKNKFVKYTGEWKEDKENGKGTLFYRTGEKKSGIFKNGILLESNHNNN